MLGAFDARLTIRARPDGPDAAVVTRVGGLLSFGASTKGCAASVVGRQPTPRHPSRS